jgi:hypothetical protein
LRNFLLTLLIIFLPIRAWAQTYVMWHLVPSEGASPEFAARVERSLRTHFQERPKSSLMDDIKMDSHLLVEGNEKFLRCGTGTGCLSGLGRAVNSNFVIAGEVELKGKRLTIRMVLVNVEKGAAASAASVVCEGAPTEAQMEELAIAMFEPKRYRGSIELDCPVAGAEVLLDKKPMGVTPLVGPLGDLPAGEHRLQVRREGHLPFESKVRVPVGKSVRVVANLPTLVVPEPPFYRDWPFWTAAGVGAVALVIAGLLHHDAGVLSDNADACLRQELECEDSYRNQADSRYLQAYLIYGVGGAGLLAAGLIVILDVVASPDPQRVRVTPAASGAGFSLTWRF